MVEPLFFAAIGSDSAVGSSFTLGGPEAKHAVSARRLTIGESIAISDGLGVKIRGTVTKVKKETLEMSIESIEQVLAPKSQLFLVQALAKGDRDELAIQACTELGLFGVIPWQADRSISIWKAEKKQKGQARWQTIVTEAAKQSLRAFIPRVDQVLDSQELISALEAFDQVLILDPEAEKSITEINPQAAGKVAIVVGPEGGISEQELESFKKAGFSSVRLGSGVLRTSTAGMAAVSYLQAKLGDWV
ncbi:MAG: 16S rRNA (uracil(1498)-N(3))-methyltransferase [Rhodoluna sp.]